MAEVKADGNWHETRYRQANIGIEYNLNGLPDLGSMSTKAWYRDYRVLVA